MHTGRRYTLFQTMNWSRDLWLGSAIWSAAVTAAYSLLGWTWLAIPWLPVASLATAVAFYLGFKTNQSYDRLWEARKIWGALVNDSRSWTRQVMSWVGRKDRDDPEEAQQLRVRFVHRHLAFVHGLAHHLRGERTELEAALKRFVPQEELQKHLEIGRASCRERV